MATSADPMVDPNAPAGDTAGNMPDDSDSPDMSSGYCIEIKVDAQGKISVGVEPAAAEAGEGGEGGEDESYQAVPTIGDAVRLVREIYNHAGSLQSDSAGDDQMAAGYK